MTKNILTIGFELASGATETAFRSKASLLDWDIILFKPLISEFIGSYDDQYKGKPSLGDASSFQLKEACEHWRREIKQAIDNGKTVIVFMPPIEEVYVDTGQREFSGTGRNQKTVRIVAQYPNYMALPLSMTLVDASGSAMKHAAHGADILAPFWAEFGPVSEYKVLLPEKTDGTCLVTKSGNRPVGAIIRSKDSAGSLVLLPDIDFYPDSFFEEKEDEQIWSTEAERFAARLTAAVVALDSALHNSTEIKPEPEWSADPKYALAKEQDLRSKLLEAERQVEEAQKRKEEVLEELKSAGRLRVLLYEKGKQLENGIIEALQLLGFHTAPYRDGSSEFDVVFECSEGRLLGEAEGKDTKAINIDKLRQLAMNVHEDLQREEVKSPAKGVLFGNGYRLTPPTDRKIQFTDKCVTAAQSSSTALIATIELYVAAQHLAEQNNDQYAKLCREKILAGVGLVTLPQPPSKASKGDA